MNQTGPRRVARLKRIRGRKTSIPKSFRRYVAPMCSCFGSDRTQNHSGGAFVECLLEFSFGSIKGLILERATAELWSGQSDSDDFLLFREQFASFRALQKLLGDVSMSGSSLNYAAVRCNRWHLKILFPKAAN